MKLLASLLIVGSLTWIGHEYARNLANRPRIIRMLKSALQILEAEIVYSQSTVQEALFAVSKQIPQPISSLFHDLASDIAQEKEQLYPVWELHINRFHQKQPLQAEDREILQQFGRTLGQHDVTQQQKYIRLGITHLERSLVEAEERNQQFGNMSRSVGFLIGMFIVLLLL
ncbi:stage III sporulation protein SpoIIIAB [Gracilibacillus caseinilyticus]|uniref:Stage III sporulation protein SpoIIIAB n=1 Tax=Gracilibacillus caseinilyticus TaxID=2932256 RepID=A0ABY4F1Q3_9BACI|nr:stage III sporulation protein SpoIIIAB [Gracilibacillus caseinilyticus]UOQ50617.1 stage III sporulation protein SpoIIIAB [Gracilibacillus caseinilyticus]